MMELDKRRLSNSPLDAIKGLEQDAFYHRYKNEPEYQAVIAYLNMYQQQLRKIQKPKRKLDSLTLEEMKDLIWESKLGVHMWLDAVSFEGEYVTAALVDIAEDGNIVAVWSVNPQFSPLLEADYGTTWVAYVKKPCEEGVQDPSYME